MATFDSLLKEILPYVPGCPEGLVKSNLRSATIEFCENYDQNCFDPNYKSLPLDHFAPILKRVFSRKPYSV